MEEEKVRRVQVTAAVPGAYELVGQIAAPAESRTPTCMESKWLTENADGSGANSANQNLAGITEVLACHFLRPYYMDPRHPSRLPYGSLRSVWTGPGRDPSGTYLYEKMAGYVLTRLWLPLPLVGTEHRGKYDQNECCS